MRGPFVMRGYWERDDATAETIRDGWFNTGEMATVDDAVISSSSTARRS